MNEEREEKSHKKTIFAEEIISRRGFYYELWAEL